LHISRIFVTTQNIGARYSYCDPHVRSLYGCNSGVLMKRNNKKRRVASIVMMFSPDFYENIYT